VPLAAEHADRALATAHRLAFPRYPGTEGDERAIRLVADELRTAGLEVAVEEFTYDVRPAFRALRAVLATCAFLFAASTWLAASAPGISLVLIGLGFAAGATLLAWAPWAERIYRGEGPTRTANVVGRRPAAGPPRLTLVLLAHHDSKSQNLTFPVRIGLTLLALAGGLTHAVALAAAAGAALGPSWLVTASGLTAAAALAVLSTLKSGNKSPGGVDNAGSVGIVLELARVLPPRIPDDVELVFLSPGAEEDHMVGAMRWLDAHLAELRGRPLWALNFDGAGSPGRLVLLNRYGAGRQLAPRLAALTRRVAAELDVPVRSVMMPPAMGIDSIPFAHRGVECLSLSSGSLGRATMAIHSAADVAEHLDRGTVARALDLAVGVAEALCRAPSPPAPLPGGEGSKMTGMEPPLPLGEGVGGEGDEAKPRR
jgi:hypothetical protein